MKKYSKIVSTLVLIMLIMVTMSTTVLADPPAPNPPVQGQGYAPNKVVANTSNTDAIKDIGYRIFGIVQVVGTILAVVILVVLGIKYMMGSAEEKAEYKKTMIPYIIGAILIFAASSIANMVYDWAQSI